MSGGYRAPLAETRLLLEHVLAYDGSIAGLPGLEHADLDTLMDVLGAAAEVCEGVLAPLDAAGDREGSTLLADGSVRTPTGWREAYRTLAGGGFALMDAAPEHGGAGLPHVAQAAFADMACGASCAFSLVFTLSHGAYHALARHGTDAQQARYLGRLGSGEWAGTMCLTEAHAGSDLGLLRTRAEPASDGAYRLTGQKVFITYGDHDLTENIVHLVLARLPDAPPGTRGISLFAVPKLLRGGTRNAVATLSLEHKMGMHASPTCVLGFDGAWGELVGPAHGGMRAMFTMMNAARLGVGIQGLGLAEAACQRAETYATERLQGRAPGGPARPDLEADPILHHPDVRRTLLLLRAQLGPARALALRVAAGMDIAARHPDAARRLWADDRVALLTPVVKAGLTDLAWSGTSDALGVFGGHGYIRDTGVERLVRDARITPIWEGTNAIQGLDLVRRKLVMDDGRAFRTFLAEARALVERLGREDDAVADVAAAALDALRLLEVTAADVLARDDAEEAAAAASDLLRLFVLTAFAVLSTRIAAAARSAGAPDGDARLLAARAYVARVLPEATARAAAARAGKASLGLV